MPAFQCKTLRSWLIFVTAFLQRIKLLHFDMAPAAQHVLVNALLKLVLSVLSRKFTYVRAPCPEIAYKGLVM